MIDNAFYVSNKKFVFCIRKITEYPLKELVTYNAKLDFSKRKKKESK